MSVYGDDDQKSANRYQQLTSSIYSARSESLYLGIYNTKYGIYIYTYKAR